MADAPATPPASGGFLKKAFMGALNQLHPFDIPSLGLRGRLGSNSWQQLALFVACSGIVATTGFLPGAMDAVTHMGKLMLDGAGLIGGAVGAKAAAAASLVPVTP